MEVCLAELLACWMGYFGMISCKPQRFLVAAKDQREPGELSMPREAPCPGKARAPAVATVDFLKLLF